MSDDDGTRCMVDACFCCYDAIDFANMAFCCVASGDILCLRNSVCCSIGAKSRGCGMTTDESAGECCKIAFFCCDCGLIQPEACCTSTQQVLCLNSTAALPFHDDYVPECVCAVCCLQCAPQCACCAKPPPNRAVKALMDRD